MATVVLGATISLGSSAIDASSSRTAIDFATPFVSWKLPSQYTQARFNVKISNAEPGGFAFTTSGIRTTTDNFVQFPSGVGLNDNFEGLCKVEIAFSQGTSGALEYVTSPYYFVYNRNLEKFFQAHSIDLTWASGGDPDNLPVNGGAAFWVQIATDMFFNNIVYSDNSIPALGLSVIEYTVGSSFLIEKDKTYFYRVSAQDGLDWGDWSHVNAFTNNSIQPPSITFTNVQHLADDVGSVIIDFDVTDSAGLPISVTFTYTGGPSPSERHPITLIDPPVKLETGSHRVIWKSVVELGRNDYKDIVLYAIPYDNLNYGDEVAYGNFEVDNSGIPQPGGRTGMNSLLFKINCGSMAIRPLSNYKDKEPHKISGSMVTSQHITSYIYQQYAAKEFFMDYKGYINGTLESHSKISDPHGGLPIDDIAGRARVTAGGGLYIAGEYQCLMLPTGGKANPYAGPSGFLFRSPVDYTQWSDAWPRPFSSRDMYGNPYLKGYLDFDGVEHDYPDHYDWDNRPSWHVGREVWGTDDAWVQCAEDTVTGWKVCSTCGGKGWVPSASGAPYARNVCPNANCVDGFDHTEPLIASGFNGKGCLAHVAGVSWVRLTTMINCRPYDREYRFGLTSRIEKLFASGASSIYTSVIDPVNAGYLAVLNTTESDLSVHSRVVGGQIAEAGASKTAVLPVDGWLGPQKKSFFWGMDPNSNYLMSQRPVPPQAWGTRIRGSMEQVYQAIPLGFRWLPRWWDAYNTIHFQYTGSRTSRINMQVSQVLDQNNRTPWIDAKPENAHVDPATGLYLIDPLTFHGYLNTINRDLYKNGMNYQLRIRQYDTLSKQSSDWAYSPQFIIQTGVSNPASVVSSVYEPWTKRIYVTFRIDDSNQRLYALTNYWYTPDDGATWTQISPGDISGDISGLSSYPGDGQNFHTLIWSTAGYSLGPGNSYRIKLECIPVDGLADIILPFFKWLSPINPLQDPAKQDLMTLMGHIETATWDETNNTWVPLAHPVAIPGMLTIYQDQVDAVRKDPSPGAPSGYYTFFNASGTLIDPSGYQAWINTPYSIDPSQTHGNELANLMTSIDQIINVSLPQDHKAIFNAQVFCRCNLIDQGFYAEQWFTTGASGVTEYVDVTAVGVVDQNGGPMTIHRLWQFQVEGAPTGPSGVFTDTQSTGLDVVYYKLDLDPKSTFDSQPYGTPLRHFLYDELNNRLTVSQVSVPPDATTSNPAIDVPLSTAPGSDTTTSLATSVTIGGILRVVPDLLPGQVSTDILPSGMITWNGNYFVRVAAYNAFIHQINARPRPLITNLTQDANNHVIFVDYELRAHQDIKFASVHSYSTGGLFPVTMIDGFSVSHQLQAPVWTTPSLLNFVSDRRAPLGDPSRAFNVIPWVPIGLDRSRPCVFYDNDLMQYQVFISQKDFLNRWRIVNCRAMELSNVCERNLLFADYGVNAIYGSWAIHPSTGVYILYSTVQVNPGDNPVIMVSTSTDADTWTTPVPVGGLTVGAYPCVILENNVYHMWYEKPDAGKVKIFYATSTDGATFTPANSGNPVYSRSSDIGSPSVIMMNNSWIMYFKDTTSGVIASVISSDGINWSSYQTELTTVSQGTPISPCVYLDRYFGNNELFMMFNYLDGSSHNSIWVTRQEDRAWVSGVPNKIMGAPGNLLNVPSSRDGLPAHCSVDMAAHGVTFGDNVKVRLNFTEWDPSDKEYQRQSEWITQDDVTQYNSVLTPAPFYYTDKLLAYPYMRV